MLKAYVINVDSAKERWKKVINEFSLYNIVPVRINAATKKEVMAFLTKSPLFSYWKIEIDRLFVYDGITYRLPDVVLN